MDQSDYDTLARLQVRLEAECAVIFGIPRREGRAISSKEYRRVFDLIDACHLIEGILDRHAKRQRRIAGSPPPPQPPVIAARPRPVKRALLPRRVRIRRTSAPLATRARRGARASPRKAAADPDPPGPPPLSAEGDPVPRILGRLSRSAAWERLPPGEREWVGQFLALGLSPQTRAAVADVFAAADHSEGERTIGPLWLGPELPVGGILIRDALGLWRILWITEILDGAPTRPAEGSA
jgi:hypothetical protein